MKRKTILTLALSAITVGTIVSSCSTPAEKVKEKQENVFDAEDDLEEADKAYLKEVNDFKKIKEERIAINEKSLADFRTRIETEKKEAKAEYLKTINELDKKNSDLKLKMENYKEDGKVNWEKFKKDFDYEMEELGKSFSDFGTKKVK